MTMLDRYGSYDDGFESWGDDSHVIEEIYDGSLSQRVDSALNAPNPTNNQQRLVKLVEGMTPSQFEAATYDEKPLLVLARAGTGKTRSLDRKNGGSGKSVDVRGDRGGRRPIH